MQDNNQEKRVGVKFSYYCGKRRLLRYCICFKDGLSEGILGVSLGSIFLLNFMLTFFTQFKSGKHGKINLAHGEFTTRIRVICMRISSHRRGLLITNDDLFFHGN